MVQLDELGDELVAAVLGVVADTRADAVDLGKSVALDEHRRTHAEMLPVLFELPRGSDSLRLLAALIERRDLVRGGDEPPAANIHPHARYNACRDEQAKYRGAYFYPCHGRRLPA